MQSFQTLSSFKKHIRVKQTFENYTYETVSSNEFEINNDGNTIDVEMACSYNYVIPNTINEPEASEVSNEKIFDVL